ncbi:MAG: YihY family inner membrane protein [Gammaproteobacteria bacterium]|nr:YihY family inner membrane protein [Gammaproteobacteria bacterium]
MLKRIWSFCLGLVSRFSREGCTLQAAGLAYVTLLSLVPLLTLSLSVLSAFPVFKGLGAKLQSMVFSNFVASSASVIEQHINTFMQQTSKLTVPGMLFLLVMGVLMIFSMEQAFNHIWKVEKRRNAIQAFLTYWAVLTLTPILIGVGLAVSADFLKLQIVSATVSFLGLKTFLLVVSPYLFTFLAFFLLYVAIPHTKVKFRYAAIGALVGALLFQLAKFGFALYITHFPTYKLLYGALATIPIFLAWLYISWLVVVFGALVSAELQRVFDVSRDAQPERLS